VTSVSVLSQQGALQACVSQRVPILLSRGLVRLVVVDSVAALFRSEFQADEGIERARHMLAFAATLHRLSHNYSTPVLCINQVGKSLNYSADPGQMHYIRLFRFSWY
jgi:DNA-repair protein XRCC3